MRTLKGKLTQIISSKETKRNAPKMILIKQSQFGLLETVNYKAPKQQGTKHVCCNFRKVAQGINEQH